MARTQKSPRKEVRRPVWAEIDLGALAENFRAIRKFVNPPEERRKTPRKILCIVKGNGYGHGGPQVAKALEKAGSDWFGVTCTEEGIAVREAGVRKPVLVLTSFFPGEESRLIEHDLTAVIHRCEQLKQLDRAAARFLARKDGKKSRKRVSFHLKMDTGMNRLGIAPGDIECFARQLAKCKHLELGGVFTHFASSEVLTNTRVGEQTRQQEERFYAALDRLRALGIDPGIVHLANSAAIVTRPETWADMVRPGAILYGYHQFFEPSELNPEMEAKLAVKPVLSFRARIISIKDLPPGARVGYNARWTAPGPSRVAVLAAGYADGLVRVLSNKGRVIVRGQMAPIIGTVSMDLTTADVTGIASARVGDIATIYGTDGATTQSVPDVAKIAGTASADLLCALGKRVPRFYLP